MIPECFEYQNGLDVSRDIFTHLSAVALLGPPTHIELSGVKLLSLCGVFIAGICTSIQGTISTQVRADAQHVKPVQSSSFNETR